MSDFPSVTAAKAGVRAMSGMRHALLVTGTDTGIGKTVVSAAILRAARERGLRAEPLKPAETGCEERDGELVPADAVALREAAASTAPLDMTCPYRLPDPLAPSVATRRAGIEIDPAKLAAVLSGLRARADLVVVESAGGLLVPLRDRWTFADFAADHDLPILVVVGSRLGAINAALLTLECAVRRNLDVVGYVWNHPTPDSDLAIETNVETLRDLTDVPCLGVVPWLDEGNASSASALTATAIAVLDALPVTPE